MAHWTNTSQGELGVKASPAESAGQHLRKRAGNSSSATGRYAADAAKEIELRIKLLPVRGSSV